LKNSDSTIAEVSKDLETPESAKEKMTKLENDMIEKQNKVEKEAAERDVQAQQNLAQSSDDPASQLKSLMTTQQSLHRLGSVFSGKANTDRVTDLA
jgi:hypothetical protein